jgi:RimJ/RimL family protein N-acetyltransferase
VLPERISDGDDLVVRCWTEDDAEPLAAAIAESTDHLRPWMAWIEHEPMDLEDRRRHIREWNELWRAGGDAIYGIWLDGRVAGGTGLHKRGVPRTLEIGYWLHPSVVGRGLATRVARVLTTAALGADGIDAVEIHHDRDNVRSSGVPQRLGYRRLDDVDAQAHAVWRIEAVEWITDTDAPPRGTAGPSRR